MSSLRKNVASQKIGFCLNAIATGNPVTAGGAGNVSIDGGAQAACAGTFTHLGTGQWIYAPTQAETNGTNISFAFTGTGAIQVGMTFFTIGYDPTVANLPTNVIQVNGTAQTARDLGQGIPNAVPGAAGGLFIAGTNAATTVTTSFTTTFTGNLTGSVGSVTGAVGSVTGAVGSVTGAVGSVTGNIGGNVVGSVASVTAGVTVTTNNDKTGYALTSGGNTAVADAMFDEANGVETGLTMRQSLRLIASTTGGKLSGAGTGTETFRNAVADAANRVVATVDSSGNRSAITYSL